jgi:hypothetical protein
VEVQTSRTYLDYLLLVKLIKLLICLNAKVCLLQKTKILCADLVKENIMVVGTQDRYAAAAVTICLNNKCDHMLPCCIYLCAQRMYVRDGGYRGEWYGH